MRRRPRPDPISPVAIVALLLSAGAAAAQTPRAGRPACDPDNGGITLPDGFCALVVADDVGPARHLVVAPNGDIFVALSEDRRADTPHGILALRDTTGDGRADVRERFGERGGTGIALDADWLYFAPDDAVLRYRLPRGGLRPAGPPDTIVQDLPADRNHAAKSIALGPDGALYVNIGAPSNACQEKTRTPGSPGLDPCPQLEDRAGIWKFDAGRLRQRQADGQRYATGIRNAVALTVHPRTGVVYAVQHGRDQLASLWPDRFDAQQSAELPSEEMIRVDEGDDFGWPYCYHDWQQGRKVLAPEYGGDGREIGRCDRAEGPIAAFPGHWAPNALLFYTGNGPGAFPASYRGGAFIAFHGSWNRAPLPQAGYKVVFVPFDGDRPGGRYTTFADGFAGAVMQPASAEHRPSGLAEGPDGSLYIADDAGGRIWRVLYTGAGR
ncbi:MAG TPA: PQQ-dependent sugar dehydrogenase [Longimicrobiales bacterium]